MSIVNNERLENSFWLGKVIDNADPRRLGRLRVQIPLLTDELPIDSLPWYNPALRIDGKSFYSVDIGKVVAVRFNTDRIYNGEYYTAEHYNINLTEMLEKLSHEEYVRFAALYFDHDWQLYHNPSEGTIWDYMKSKIKITPRGDLVLALRDNSRFLYLGSETANQSAILGDHFLKWLDQLVDTLQTAPYLGNLGAPVLPNPNLIKVLADYKAKRNNVFLSKNVFLNDNDDVEGLDRNRNAQRGDGWSSNEKNIKKLNVNTVAETGTDDNPKPVADNNNLTSTQKDVIKPDANKVKDNRDKRSGDGIQLQITPTKEVVRVDTNSKTPEQIEEDADNEDIFLAKRNFVASPGSKLFNWPDLPPPSYAEAVGTSEPGTFEVPANGYKSANLRGYDWGTHPLSIRRKLTTVAAATNSVDLNILPEAAAAFNRLFAEYSLAQFPGKQELLITSGYRTLSTTSGNVGTHGGIALDIWYGNTADGVNTYSPPGVGTAVSAEFRHPVYQWFYKYAPKFGISQPPWVYGDNKTSPCECWHWEYLGDSVGTKDAYNIHSVGFRPNSFNWDKHPFDFLEDAKLLTFKKDYKGTGTLLTKDQAVKLLK